VGTRPQGNRWRACPLQILLVQHRLQVEREPWRYAKAGQEPEMLLMQDHTQTLSPINQLHADDAQRTLGVYLAPDGNNKKQLQILLTKTRTWADKA